MYEMSKTQFLTPDINTCALETFFRIGAVVVTRVRENTAKQRVELIHIYQVMCNISRS